MGAYSNIPLQVMTPIEAQTKAATLGDLLQRRQLQQAQIQEYNARTMEAQARAQQQQRAVDAAQSLGQLISTNTTSNPDGTFTTDHGAVMKGLADNGYGLEALKYDADRRADLENGAKLLQQQTATRQTQAQRLSELAGPLSIPRVNWDETDPQKKQQQISQAQIATTRAASQAAREGLIDPQHLQALQGTPYTRETEQALDQMTGQGMNAAAQFKQIGDHIEDVHKKIMDAALERKAGAEATKEELGVTSQITSAMAAPATTLGGAAAPVSPPQPAAATPTAPAIAGQGAPAGTNVSGNRLNVPSPQLGQYDTKLTPQEETAFQAWKAKYAPNDSGADYDLRGAFKAGLTPDPQTGHWPDTFKKPNHATFSDQSQYASAAPDKAGHWEGDKFVPPSTSTSARSPQWTQEKQDNWDAMRKLVPAGALPFLPPQWSPQAQATAQRLGLTAEQQVINARERVAGGPKTKDEFAAAMTDTTRSPEERQRWRDAFDAVTNKGFTEPQINGAVRQMDTLDRQINDLQEKESREWELRGQYGDLLDESKTPPDTEQVNDPRTGRPIRQFTIERDDKGKATKTGTGRTYIQQRYDQTQANAQGFARKAQALRDQATEVRKRFGFGEFGGGEGTPAATPAGQAPTTPPAGPRSGGGRIQMKLPNGSIKIFPNQKAVEDFAAAAGLTLSK